ncbi:LysM peptidoglycan-binding domain-containing protein [Candidatus Saccharibacteria bacterium]|nr:LysM peptidoglycan-binding domain-containing protein [Candidatus Saccharibacteria bacterium]
MTENKNNQNTVDQDDPNKIKLTARGKKVAATALTAAVAIAGVAGYSGVKSEESASANSKQEQPDPRYKVQEGDTLEGIAQADLKERAKDQAFAEDPTPAEVDVREREIAGASNLSDPEEFTTPDELKVGQELVVPDSTEVPISVTPEVPPEDLPPRGPTTQPQN